jgi:hypothetical protein
LLGVGWFDIDQFDDMQKPASDPPGIQESIDRIKRLIRVEVESGVPSHRIVVMGISQACDASLSENMLAFLQSPTVAGWAYERHGQTLYWPRSAPYL